jgi:hypothetical protein
MDSPKCSGSISTGMCSCSYDDLISSGYGYYCCSWCCPIGQTDKITREGVYPGHKYHICLDCKCTVGLRKCQQDGCSHYVAQDCNKQGKSYCSCHSPFDGFSLRTPLRSNFANDGDFEKRSLAEAKVPEQNEWNKYYPGWGEREKKTVYSRYVVKINKILQSDRWSDRVSRTVINSLAEKHDIVTRVQTSTPLYWGPSMVVASYAVNPNASGPTMMLKALNMNPFVHAACSKCSNYTRLTSKQRTRRTEVLCKRCRFESAHSLFARGEIDNLSANYLFKKAMVGDFFVLDRTMRCFSADQLVKLILEFPEKSSTLFMVGIVRFNLDNLLKIMEEIPTLRPMAFPLWSSLALKRGWTYVLAQLVSVVSDFDNEVLEMSKKMSSCYYDAYQVQLAIKKRKSQ